MVESASQFLENTARLLPRKVAIEMDGRELTWSEFDGAVDRLARQLVTVGLSPGESVMIMSGNSPEFLILSFAVWRAGGAMAVVHASFGSNELDYAVVNAEPRFLFVEEESRAAATAALKRTGRSGQVFAIANGIAPLGEVRPFPGELPEVSPETVGIIGFTSGTTGQPKPVAHSHRSIGRGTDACADIWRITSADTILVAMPLSWMAGLIILSVTAATRGAKIQLLRRYAAEDALKALVEHRVTFLFGATTMFVKIVNAWRQQNCKGEFNLRCCISAGEARNESAFNEFRKITGTPVLDSYGASECWPFVTHDPGAGALPPPGSAGKLVAGAKIRLLSPDGHEVARGEVGEAQAHGLCMMLEYWKEPELTAKAMTPDGWYRTGDYARMDDDGFVFVLGRVSDLILTPEGNVYPAEVEQVLSELEYVAQAAVVGLPERNNGQSVAAAIVAMPGTNPDVDTIQAYCATRLSRCKIPNMIRIVKELPHNASGKVLRREVIQVLSKIRELAG